MGSERLRIAFDRALITSWLLDKDASTGDADLYLVDLPFEIRKRGVGRRLVIEGQGASQRRIDQPLIDMIARAHAYLGALTDGKGLGRKQVADQFGVHPEDVSRLLPLAYLSPGIVEAIVTGRQPADLAVRHLTRGIELPISWAEQEKLLGV